MGVRESHTESETAEEISFGLSDSIDGDSYIEIDLQRSASAAENRVADAEFEFRLSVSSPMRGDSHHLPADMLFCNGRLLPLHCLASSAGDGGSQCHEDRKETGNKKERCLGEESSVTGQAMEMRRRPESGRRALSFRKSSSMVGAEEEHEIRNPMDNPDDLELTTLRDQYYKSALTVGKLPESTTTGLEKLLMRLRPRGQTSGSFYGHRPSRREKRIRKAKEIIDKCWRIVNPFQAHKGRREGDAAAVSCESGRGRRLFGGRGGASCREDSGVRSCPTSLGSSPIHWRVNSFAYARELILRDRDNSVHAAIAHCKNSSINDVVVT